MVAAEVERLRQAAAGLERIVAELKTAAAAAADEAAGLEETLAGQQPEAWADALAEKRALVEGVRAALAQARAEAAAAAAETDERRAELERRRATLRQAAEATAGAGAALAAAAGAQEAAAAAQAQLQERLDALQREVPELRAALAAEQVGVDHVSRVAAWALAWAAAGAPSCLLTQSGAAGLEASAGACLPRG